MTSNEELIKLIKDSFLSEEDKGKLVVWLKKEGAGVGFFGLFNELLCEEVQKRGREYEKFTFRLNQLSDKLEDDITANKKEIEDKIEKQLSAVKKDDTEKRAKIWVSYYGMLDELGKKYETDLRQVLAEVMRED